MNGQDLFYDNQKIDFYNVMFKLYGVVINTIFILPGILVLPALFKTKMRKNPIISIIFQMIAGILSHLISSLIILLIKSVYEVYGYSFYFNIFMVIFYYLYKLVDFLWFEIVKFVILLIESLVWYDLTIKTCSFCLEKKTVLINRFNKNNRTEDLILSTCGKCSYLICRPCYLRYYMKCNACPQCKIIKDNFDIENINHEEYIEICIKTIAFLIAVFI